MEKSKYTIAMVAGGLLVLFAIQNMARVELNFLFWSFQTHRFVLIAIVLIIGIVIGWALGSRRKKKSGDGGED